MANVEIRKTTRGTVPRVDFNKIAGLILGKRYELSLVLTGDSLMQRLNSEHRNKKYTTNVLAFPIAQNEGEIFINVRKAEQEAKALSATKRERITYLFVHACLHLKGLDHGKKMDALELSVMKRVERQI